MRGLAAAIVCLAGCYTGARATRDVNRAWQGHSRGAIQSRRGKPVAEQPLDGGTALVWSYSTRHLELPSGGAALRVTPTSFDFHAEASPGAAWTTTTQAVATVDTGARIVAVEGPSLHWGAPRDANLRWGMLFGGHVGLGRLDDTGTPLPSGGVYIGGMLGPRLGLVGSYGLVSGKGDGGGAMGMDWAIAAQWWPLARVWVRAGPAMVLSWDPGFDNAKLAPGVATGASYALIRLRVFVLDLRLDAIAAPGAVFGNLGVGVNIN